MQTYQSAIKALVALIRMHAVCLWLFSSMRIGGSYATSFRRNLLSSPMAIFLTIFPFPGIGSGA